MTGVLEEASNIEVGAAAATALMAVLIGLWQLSPRAQLRDTEQWARDARAAKGEGSQRDALDVVQAAAAARLVAMSLVPNRLLVSALLFVPLPVWSLVTSISHGLTLATLLYLTMPTSQIWMVVRRITRVYVERRRIAHLYALNLPVTPLSDMSYFAHSMVAPCAERWTVSVLTLVLCAAIGTFFVVPGGASPVSVFVLFFAAFITYQVPRALAGRTEKIYQRRWKMHLAADEAADQ